MEGWIKLYRNILEHPVFKSSDDKLFKTFIYCLLRAVHKETQIFFSGRLIDLKPGEFIIGREQAAQDLGFGGKTFDRKVDSLRKMQILSRRTTNKFSIISILNWETYQGNNSKDDQQLDQQMTSNCPADDQEMTTYKNIKNIKNNILRDPPDPSLKEFINFWEETFKEKFGQPYLVSWGKEGKLVKSLLKTYSLTQLKNLAEIFFKSGDHFIQSSGYTIGAFYSQINKLIAEQERRKSSW